MKLKNLNTDIEMVEVTSIDMRVRDLKFPKLKFLETVKVTHSLKRKEHEWYGEAGKHHRSKYWDIERCEQERIGAVIGKRRLSNGEVDDYDNAPVYIPQLHFTVFLVIFNMRDNPVYVLPQHIVKL